MTASMIRSDSDGPVVSLPAAAARSDTRRWLLRGGALAAGAAVVGAALPSTAEAADGDPVELGADNTATSTTRVALGPSGGPEPTLALANPDGPSLELTPVSGTYEDAPALELGQVANTDVGPVVGVDSLLGQTTTQLVTGIEVNDLSTPAAVTPKRILDTRSAEGRVSIVRRSPGALDAQNRLKPGAWLDVEISIEDPDFLIDAAFLNVVAASPQVAGYLSVYPPGPFPGTSTLNFSTGQTIANQAFVAVAQYDRFVIARVRTSALTSVVVDLTGVVYRVAPLLATSRAARSRVTKTRNSSAAGRQLRSNLTDRLRRNLAR